MCDVTYTGFIDDGAQYGCKLTLSIGGMEVELTLARPFDFTMPLGDQDTSDMDVSYVSQGVWEENEVEWPALASMDRDEYSIDLGAHRRLQPILGGFEPAYYDREIYSPGAGDETVVARANQVLELGLDSLIEFITKESEWLDRNRENYSWYDSGPRDIRVSTIKLS